MIVLKIGGSLYASDYLQEWLALLSEVRRSVVIVPGGGPFADQVRAASEKWHLPLSCAHDMAVLGMQQYGHMMIGLNPHLTLERHCHAIINSSKHQKVVVWAPYDEVLAANEIEKSWQTTSDSLALWLAIKISAKHLCIVKSAEIDGKSIQQLIAQHVVDSNFEAFLPNYTGRVHFYHATQMQRFIDDVNNDVFS